MDLDESICVKLDEEYKMGLGAIRPYIARLTSADEAKLCKLWLAKLHESVGERQARNVYLFHLTEQVKNRKLSDPFNKLPPRGILRQWKEQEEASSWSDFSSSSSIWDPMKAPEQTSVKKGYLRHYKSSEGSIDSSDNVELVEKERCNKMSLYNQESKPFDFTLPRANFPPNSGLGGFEQSQRYYATLPDGPISHLPSVSEESQEKKILSLINTINNLKAENKTLKNEMKVYQNTSQRAKKNLHAVSEEVIVLREKLQELRRLKDAMESQHGSMLKEYKISTFEKINKLTQRLSTTLDQNSKLETRLEKLKSEVENFFNEKFYVEESKKLQELNEEISLLKNKHKEDCDKYTKCIAEKDKELQNLNSQLKKQCYRMEEEVSLLKKQFTSSTRETQGPLKHQIQKLKKKISKLQNKNEKLKNRFQLFSRGMKINLLKCHPSVQGSKPEAVSSTNEAEVEINALEEKYRNLLQELEKKYSIQHHNDMMRIKKLEEQMIYK